MAAKTTCARCSVHCYNPKMRRGIRVVMRYSGPRMFFAFPQNRIPQRQIVRALERTAALLVHIDIPFIYAVFQKVYDLPILVLANR